jgi:hypothetical protein
MSLAWNIEGDSRVIIRDATNNTYPQQIFSFVLLLIIPHNDFD